MLLYKGLCDWKRWSSLNCSKEQLLRSSVFIGKFLTMCLYQVCHCFILHTLQLPSLTPFCWLFSYLVKNTASLKHRALMSTSSFFFSFLMVPALSECSSVLCLAYNHAQPFYFFEVGVYFFPKCHSIKIKF